ncbi:MAG: hypothetical protein KDD13_02310 [Mangrovimonas sp.]|nr:hypothetical protein [Mangrovimonas sp.]
MGLANFPIRDISHLIPQKAPFEMVDTLLGFSQTSVTSSFTIKSDNLFISNGKFTEEGLVENMAQTVALHTGFSYFIENKPAPTGYIGSIKTVEIFNLPAVKDTLTTTATILHEFMGVTMVEVIVKLGNLELAKGEMKTVIAK